MPSVFQPVEWFIGLRYLRPRQRRGVVSFMTGASLGGIALGVAALIVILSVMNGLETETRTRLLEMSAHSTLRAPGGLEGWEAVRDRVAELPGVASVSPYVSFEAMLGTGATLQPVQVRGIVPGEDASLPGIDLSMDVGDIASLVPGETRIVIGVNLSIRLGATLGDKITMHFPAVANGQLRPRQVAFDVAGVFRAGIAEYDSGLALVNLDDASSLRGLGGLPEGLSVQLEEPLAHERFRAAATAAFPELQYSDWAEEHRNLFTAIAIEKIMMTIVLLFIVAVAAFNIVASLMMVVIDKEKDIAILRTCGLEPRRVARLFLVQGGAIGVTGVAIGVVAGLAIAFNVHIIVPWLERTFGFQIMPATIYYVNELPSEVHFADVVMIPLLALVIAAVATIYPARRAAAIAPAVALRYD
jgi:lipoprotein-releasing system permease protein